MGLVGVYTSDLGRFSEASMVILKLHWWRLSQDAQRSTWILETCFLLIFFCITLDGFCGNHEIKLTIWKNNVLDK